MIRPLLLLAMTTGFFLAGCGQSGPLYLPGDPSEIREAPRPQDIRDDDEDEEPEETP